MGDDHVVASRIPRAQSSRDNNDIAMYQDIYTAHHAHTHSSVVASLLKLRATALIGMSLVAITTFA